MATRPIRPFGDPILRQRAAPLERIDKSTRRLVADMIESMRAADGMGLAAPQIGISSRVVVAEVDDEVYVLINPEVLWTSRQRDVADEGCLSLPGYRGEVERHVALRVRAFDRNGKERILEAVGMLARCLQHEIDHLDGILYTNRMKPGTRLYLLEDEDGEAGADEPPYPAVASS